MNIMTNVSVVTFDLDGTLVDTLPSIANAFNEILKEYGYEIFSVEKYMDFIGNGFGVAFDRIREVRNIKEDKEEFLSRVRDYYNLNYLKGAKIYEGMDKLLTYLEKKNIVLAVITNKDQITAEKYCNILLNKWKFKYIFGNPENKAYPPKPYPYGLKMIVKDGYSIDEIVHIGDMIVDYTMAKNMGVRQIHCNYGYEKRNFEFENCVDRADEIIGIIK